MSKNGGEWVRQGVRPMGKGERERMLKILRVSKRYLIRFFQKK